MTKLENVVKNLQISDEDVKNIQTISSLIKNRGFEIIDSVVNVLAGDPKVLDILRKNRFPVKEAKEKWYYWLNILFSFDMSDESYNKLKNIGYSHVDANVDEVLVIETTALFMNATISKIFETKISNYEKIVPSIIKIFALSLAIMLDSYQDELVESFLEFTGMKRVLFEKEIEIQRRTRNRRRKTCN